MIFSPVPNQRHYEKTLTHRGPVSRGRISKLYYLLSNPIYIGKVRHRDKVYDGEHEAIISLETFEQTQKLLATQAPVRTGSINGTQQHLLTGLLFDADGQKLRAVHANKKGMRYHYYVSRQLVEGRRKSSDGWRLPASEIDATVEESLIRLLNNQPQLSDWIQEWIEPTDLPIALERSTEIQEEIRQTSASKRNIIRKFVRRITVYTRELVIVLDRHALATLLIGRAFSIPSESENEVATIICPISLRRRGVETKLVLSDGTTRRRTPDTALIDLLKRSNTYLTQLTDGSGKSLNDIAALNQTDPSEVSRLLPFAFLSPKIVDMIATGQQPVEMTAQRLSRMSDLPLSWKVQNESLDL